MLYSDVNYIVKEWQLHQRDGRRWVEPAGHLAGHTDVINCMAAAARGAVLSRRRATAPSAWTSRATRAWRARRVSGQGVRAASGRLVFTAKDGLVRIFRFEREPS